MLNRLGWHARRSLQQVGWPGAAGVVLIFAGIGFQQRILMPMQGNVAEIRHETQGLRANAATRHALKSTNSPAAQLDEFYRFFPEDNSLTDILGKVYDAAAKENLTLEQGEYRLAPEQDGKLQRYDLIFPVRGQYTQIRHFISHVLQDSPSLALEGVNFNRKTSMEIGVEAQVRLTLYLRAKRNG